MVGKTGVGKTGYTHDDDDDGGEDDEYDDDEHYAETCKWHCNG